MSEIDAFSVKLFEQAKRFLEKAQNEESDEGKRAYLHASLLIGVSALEAHINAIADELLTAWTDLNVLERAILSEKEFIFENGDFELSGKLKMYRLIERFEFIFKRFGFKKPLDKNQVWWIHLKEALRMRNELVHPKENIVISEDMVRHALQGILEGLNAAYKSLYGAAYPGYRRGLDSVLLF